MNNWMNNWMNYLIDWKSKLPVFLSTRASSTQRGRMESMVAFVLSCRPSKLRFSFVSPQEVRAGLALS